LILVADDERDILSFVEVNLRLEGFRVATAEDGEEALRTAREMRPDLIILDVMMPKMDGLEVCRAIRADGLIGHTPVILLTARGLSADKLVGLTAGADDYILKPFDLAELVARVRSTLRRARDMRSLSPLTGLPGGPRIEQEIDRRVAEGEQPAVLYVDLDNFKAYNDHYGFARGDLVIGLAAEVLQAAVESCSGRGCFVGHVGGDDFVALVPPEDAVCVAEACIRAFDERVPGLYDEADRERGHIQVEDRSGNMLTFPVVSMSIGVATSAWRPFSDYRELIAAATEMKGVAKRSSGSSFALDRRHE